MPPCRSRPRSSRARPVAAQPGKPEWLRARLPPLLALAPVAAKFLPAADRSEVREIAREVAGQFTDPEIKTALDNFAKAVGGS